MLSALYAHSSFLTASKNGVLQPILIMLGSPPSLKPAIHALSNPTLSYSSTWVHLRFPSPRNLASMPICPHTYLKAIMILVGWSQSTLHNNIPIQEHPARWILHCWNALNVDKFHFQRSCDCSFESGTGLIFDWDLNRPFNQPLGVGLFHETIVTSRIVPYILRYPRLHPHKAIITTREIRKFSGICKPFQIHYLRVW